MPGRLQQRVAVAPATVLTLFTLLVDRGRESAPGTFDGHWQEQKPNNKSQDYVYAMILSARLEVLYGRPRLFPLKYG